MSLPLSAVARLALSPQLFAMGVDEMVYLRSDPPDGAYTRHIYKSVIDGETWYLGFTWHEGLLVGIQRQDE